MSGFEQTGTSCEQSQSPELPPDTLLEDVCGGLPGFRYVVEDEKCGGGPVWKAGGGDEG